MTEGHENNHESQLSTERMEELEIQIQQDEKPIKFEPDESGLPEPERKKKKLKRELRKEALTRMEEAARTEADFEKVTEAWDKLDANRERKERYHEIKRSGDEIPLEHGRAVYGAAFPEWFNDPNYSAIQHGRNLDVIFNCTYELHQFTSHPILLKILKDLKMEYKDVLFFTIIREINRQGVTVLLVEQNANMALKIADQAYVLETGNITMSGPADELLHNDDVRKAYLGD